MCGGSMPQPARFNARVVLDANHEQIGTVIGSELSDGTREPTSILVELDQQTRETLGIDEETLWLDYERVREIRRGELTLGDPMHQLVERKHPGPGSFTAHDLPAASKLAREAAEA